MVAHILFDPRCNAGEVGQRAPGEVPHQLDLEPPFGSKTAVLTDAEIADLVAFLGTLTDR